MKIIYVFIFFLVVAACNRGPYSNTNKQYKKQAKEFAKIIQQAPLVDSMNYMGDWIGTTNFNLRKPNFVIIHHIAQNSCAQTYKTFTTTSTEVSAHYVICRDGTVTHLLNDYLRAWHAGAGRWGNLTDINSSSIGIELDNNGSELFPETQINSLLLLLDNLKRAYNIPSTNFIGHADIAPTRKVDPSRFFPWKQLADKGFGSWYGDTTSININTGLSNVDALRIIGYDIRDTVAAIRSFRLHYMQDSSTVIDESAKKILFSLYSKLR